MASQEFANEFDQISDDIDFSAIGEEEWHAIQTQPPDSASYSSQPGTMDLPMPQLDGHLDNVVGIAGIHVPFSL